MKVYMEELTPEEIELHERRALIKSQLRGDCKAENEDKVVCTYCRSELSNSQTRISHIIPPAHGGATELSNMVLACSSCCEAKKGRTLPEWVERLNGQLDGVQTLIQLQARKEEKPAA